MAFLLHFLVLLLLSPHPAAYPYRKCEGDDYDTGSLFQSNLNLLLSSLSSTNSTFVTDDKGSPPNRAYGLFLCRGDITCLPLCHNCALNATQEIQHLCPFSKQATVWYDTCQLRYSDLSFNGSYYDIEPVIDSAEQKATDPDTFIKLRGELLDKLCERAAYNSSLLFATGTASVGVNDSPEIYGLVQCTRDLSKDKCYQCLQESFSDSLKQFDAVKWGRVLEKSCNFRYEAFKFFEGVPAVLLTLPPSSPPPSSTPTQRKDGKEPDLFFGAQRRGVMISLSCVSWRFRPGWISLPCVSCQSPIGAPGVVALEGFLGTLVVLPEMRRGGWFQSGFFGGIFQAKERKSFIWRISYFCEGIF